MFVIPKNMLFRRSYLADRLEKIRLGRGDCIPDTDTQSKYKHYKKINK